MTTALLAGPNGDIGILTKLAAINKSISGYVGKDGKNTEQKYKYVTEAAYLALIRPHLAEQHVLMVPVEISDTFQHVKQKPIRSKTEEFEGLVDSMIIEHLTLTVAFFDADDGSALYVKVRASGSDQNDKTTYKAMTGAMKYAIGKTFNLATGDDPEDDRFSEPLDESEKAPTQPEKPAPKAPPAKAAPKAAPAPAPVTETQPEEEAPEEKPAPKPAPKPAATKPAAKAAPKAAPGRFNGQVYEGVDLDTVVAEMETAETPADVSATLSKYMSPLPVSKRGGLRQLLNPVMKEIIDSRS